MNVQELITHLQKLPTAEVMVFTTDDVSPLEIGTVYFGD